MNTMSLEIPYKVRVAVGFLRRPVLYRELCRIVGRRLLPRSPLEDTLPDAQRWCAESAVTVEDYLRRECAGADLRSIREQFVGEFAEAADRVAKCRSALGGPAGMDVLYQLCNKIQAERVIETGVAYGWSSLAILLSLQSRAGARLFSTDMPYPERDADQFVGCAVPDRLRQQWRLARRPDRDALPRILKQAGTIDLCHYDSDKSYSGRRWAYDLLWDALRPGGYFMSDDVGDNVAFRDFAASVGRTSQIVSIPSSKGGQYLGILRK